MITVGQRFKQIYNRPWVDGAQRGNHYSITIIEVTRVRGGNAEYKTVEVLEESGRPSFGGDPINVTGGFYIPLWKHEPYTLEDWLLDHKYPTANIPDLAACIRDQYKKMSGIHFRESLEQDLSLTEWEALQVFNLVRP